VCLEHTAQLKAAVLNQARSGRGQVSAAALFVRCVPTLFQINTKLKRVFEVYETTPSLALKRINYGKALKRINYGKAT
jgi:biotin synthase-related radical SAM superfamily protein